MRQGPPMVAAGNCRPHWGSGAYPQAPRRRSVPGCAGAIGLARSRRHQADVDRLGSLDPHRRHLPRPPDGFDVFPRRAVSPFHERQQLNAESRHVLVDGEALMSSGPPPYALFHFARKVGCPNISLSMIKAVLPMID